MHAPPPLPALDEVPPDHLRGHVWVQELLEGGILRFEVANAGYLRFAGARRSFEEAPLPLAAGVRHVREAFGLTDYLDTVDDPERYTFVAVATRRGGIDYDWDRLPPALGAAIRDGEEGRWLPPDRVDGVFDRLGPEPVNTLQREVSVERRDLSNYEVPDSDWDDGPAAGVVFADKHGNRAMLANPSRPAPPAPTYEPVEALVDRFLTDDLLGRVAASAPDRGPEALLERTLERLFREHHAWLVDDGDPVVPVGDLRSVAAERVRRWYDDESGA